MDSVENNEEMTCYGCSIDHPSQIQHQGEGGCLEDIPKVPTILEK